MRSSVSDDETCWYIRERYTVINSFVINLLHNAYVLHQFQAVHGGVSDDVRGVVCAVRYVEV